MDDHSPPFLTLHSASPAQTTALAQALAAALRPGDSVLLSGQVGAGKTHLARAVIQARQGDMAEDVPSPTFTIVQTYDDPQGTEIWHADLYRLTHADELTELGLDEARDHAITLVEWPERLGFAPDGALSVTIMVGADADARDITLRGAGWAARLADLPRAIERAAFIESTGRGDQRVTALAGDASARRYFRLTGGLGPAILMDAPVDGNGPPERFTRVARWLTERGFSAPRILAEDAERGFLLLEDLGDDLVARLIDAHPEIYPAITAFLVALHQHAPPDWAPVLDGPALSDQVGLFAEHYLTAVGATTDQRALARGIGPAIAALYGRHAGDAPVLALRDFHAENLLWLPERPDVARLGLLDFQDAVAAHPAYDLISVLADVRRDTPPGVAQAEMRRYAEMTGRDPVRFATVCGLLTAQRNLRIMGIFTRLALSGKPRYLAFMPRVWAQIGQALADPALADLAAIVERMPAPDPAIVERIMSRCPR
ncbi:tRNA (adenosine(37)-N6)-threonylcarbamoyltransferase complex ATPase subunit type 1 TsaE [Paracoccus pacificus]|uniref:tRNA threonylcarbamoyladenosine biosynthesis protein TsaE n=1 Tax=Paracoccus pacificus TaxID=1463598 RepID=A0ABW4R2Z6_9RHOB